MYQIGNQEVSLVQPGKLELFPSGEYHLAPLARLERAAHGLGIRCSIHLSYRGDGCKYTIFLNFRQRESLSNHSTFMEKARQQPVRPR